MLDYNIFLYARSTVLDFWSFLGPGPDCSLKHYPSFLASIGQLRLKFFCAALYCVYSSFASSSIIFTFSLHSLIKHLVLGIPWVLLTCASCTLLLLVVHSSIAVPPTHLHSAPSEVCLYQVAAHAPSPYYTSVSVCLILSTFHIRIQSNPSKFRPRVILLLLLFGYNPYQPNPIAPRPLIVFCLLFVLCSVLTLLFHYV